jgi:mRNA interferase MazF
MDLNQYQIVWVNLDPTIGSEIKKTRPCLIISPDEMNRHLNTIVVAPITNTSKSYPTRIELTIGKITGWIVLDQIRSIDKTRVTGIEYKLENEVVTSVKSILKETYVD